MTTVVKIKDILSGENLKKILFVGIILVSMGNVCFSQGKYQEMKRHYQEEKFSLVVSMYKDMSTFEKRNIYSENEEEILLMAARARVEIIKEQSDIYFASREIQRIFYRLLEMNRDMTIDDLHLPGNNRDVFIKSFREAYTKLFGKLVIKAGKPGIDIKVDGQYKFTTQKSNEAVELFLWVGPDQSYKTYEVSFEHDYHKYETIKTKKVYVTAGKIKHVKVKLKRSLTLEKTHFLLAFEQNIGTYSRRFNEETLKFIQPSKDISTFEVGIGVSDSSRLSVKYGKNYNWFISEGSWEGKDVNEYLDYTRTDLEIFLAGGKDYALADPGKLAFRVGFRYLKLENINFGGNKLNSTYYLFVNDFFYDTRPGKRNAVYFQLGGGYFLGASKLEFYYNDKMSPTFGCFGFSLSAELCASLNRRFDISIGGLFELLHSSYTGEKYDWLPEELQSDTISLLKGFTRITIRF